MARKLDPVAALRKLLPAPGRRQGDANAAAKGKLARRAGRRAAGKASGRIMQRMFG